MPALRQCATDVLVLRGSPALGDAVNLASRLEGLTKVSRGKVCGGRNRIAALAAAHPAQKLYALYRARYATFRIEPPLPDWDGATKFAVK